MKIAQPSFLSPMLHQIDRIFLRVPMLASAVSYYRDTLGMTLLREEKQSAAFSLEGGAELILRADPDQPAEEIYYRVDDVRDLFARRDQLRLKFVQSPQQVARGYKAAVKDPFGNVLLLLDRTTEHDAENASEDLAAEGGLFEAIESSVAPKRELLIKLYVEVGRTADDLPYTPQFEELYNAYAARHGQVKPTRKEVWRHLLNLRKGGKLLRLGESRNESPAISPGATDTLRGLLGDDIGKRDRLPYSDRFDTLVDAFNKTQQRPLSPHLVWRLVAKLAK